MFTVANGLCHHYVTTVQCWQRQQQQQQRSEQMNSRTHVKDLIMILVSDLFAAPLSSRCDTRESQSGKENSWRRT